jgi:hypothetical protein
METHVLTTWLQALELQQVAVTATIDPTGRLRKVEGLWPKLLAAAEAAARLGSLCMAQGVRIFTEPSGNFVVQDVGELSQ